MADITAYHSIDNVDLSASTLWYKALADIKIAVSLHLQVSKKVSMKTEFQSSESDTFEEISTDEMAFSTKRNAVIPYEKLKVGTNILKLTITDEFAPENGTGITEYTTKIVVENRDSFKINRTYNFASEYLISGSGKIDTNNNLSVTTTNGVRSTIVIPRKAIEMDGRSQVRSITIHADKDNIGFCETDVTVNSQEDMGDCYMQTIPFTDVLTFQKIDKVQAINASDI